MAFDPDAYLAKEDKKKGFDPDAYLKKTQPESALQTFGRSTASMADSALNALTGTLDYGAYALARAAGRTPEQATLETTSPKDVVGRAFGVTGTPGYEQAPLRQLGTAIGETMGENVIQPLAQRTGLPEEDVANMINTGMIAAGPATGRATAATGRAVKSAAQVPVDVVKGAVGRATNYIAEPGVKPTGYQVPSSRIPLGDTFIPAKEMAELKQGMPISEGAIRPISELAPGPILALSGGEIPVAGQAARAFGERVGQTYSNPYTAAADIGSMFLTGGIPVLTAGRGALGLAQAGADAYLGRKGFTALTPEQRTALNQGSNPFFDRPTGPVSPQAMAAAKVNPAMATTPAAQAAVATTEAKAPLQLGYTPAKPPTMYVAPEGQTGTNLKQVEQQALKERYAPQPTGAVAPAPEVAPVKREPVYKDAGEMRKALIGKVTPDEMDRLVREKFPAVEPRPVVDTADGFQVRAAMKQSAKAGITSKNNKIQIDQAVFNDAAKALGMPDPDFSKMPDLKDMSLADARKAVETEINRQYKEANVYAKTTRGPNQSTLVKQAEAERTAGKTAEQLAAEEAAMTARLDNLNTFLKTGKTGSTPKAEPPKTPPVSGPVVPEGTTPPAPMSKEQLLAMIKARSNKGSAPPGTSQLMTQPSNVSKMITNDPDVVKTIKDVPWSNRSDFEQSVFMHELGANPDSTFIAKMKEPEGSIIRAVDNEIDSEAIQYANGDRFMIRKIKDEPDAVDYSIFTKDGIRYEISKYADGIRRIELLDNDKILADYVKSPDQNTGVWVVMDRDPKGKGGGQMIYNVDIKFAKDPKTRKLHKELPKIDFNEIINEQLGRLEDLKKGK